MTALVKMYYNWFVFAFLQTKMTCFLYMALGTISCTEVVKILEGFWVSVQIPVSAADHC